MLKPKKRPLKKKVWSVHACLKLHRKFVKLQYASEKENDKAKLKKVSASTNMAQIFTGGRTVLFFAKLFYTQIWYANL